MKAVDSIWTVFVHIFTQLTLMQENVQNHDRVQLSRLKGFYSWTQQWPVLGYELTTQNLSHWITSAYFVFFTLEDILQ